MSKNPTNEQVVMEFPRDVFQMPGRCIAIIGSGRGRDGKKWAGKPILHWRPNLNWQKELWQASRLSFHLNNSPIPRRPNSRTEGLVLHTCDNEWCVEPVHLYLGSAAQNAKDMFERHPTIHQDRSAARTGHKHSPEAREKMALAKKGNKNSLGSKRSPETRTKMSASQQARQVEERMKRDADTERP